MKAKTTRPYICNTGYGHFADRKSGTNRNDTSHDNGDDASHDEVRSEDTHSGDTDTKLGGTITRSCSVR